MNAFSPRPRGALALLTSLALTFFLPLLPPAGAQAAGLAAGALPPVIINEILAHTDPPQKDSIELHNTTAAPVSVGGWCLSDSTNEPCRFVLPPGVTVAPWGFLVLTRDNFDFGLSEMGESVVLTPGAGSPYAGTEHNVRFGASDNGVSLGRVVTSDGREFFPQQSAVTLGAPNSPPAAGPVVLGAIMYNPSGSAAEYIELVNVTDVPVTLCDPLVASRCWVLEGVGNFAFPPGFTLAGKSVVYVAGSAPDAFRAQNAVPAALQVAGPFSGNLSNGGERVVLSRPGPPNADGTLPYIVADEVTYGDTAPWPPQADGGGASLQRRVPAGFGQEPYNWRAGPALGGPPEAAVVGFVPRDLPNGTRELSWSTDGEANLLGFTLLYSASGERADAVRVGPDLLPAQGNPHFGARYAVADGSPGAAGTYWLEAVGWRQDRRDVATIPAVLPERVYLPFVQ